MNGYNDTCTDLDLLAGEPERFLRSEQEEPEKEQKEDNQPGLMAQRHQAP